MWVKQPFHHRKQREQRATTGRALSVWGVGRVLLAIWLVLGTVAPVRAETGSDAESPPPIEIATEPAPTEHPTEVPVIEVPTPTEVTLPTETPLPEPTATSTLEPVEEPTQPAVATETATSTPEPTVADGTPTGEPEEPTPTVEAAIPFAPVLECIPREGAERAIAGDDAWALLACELTWDTENVAAIEFTIPERFDDWSVVLIEETDAADQRPLTERIDERSTEIAEIDLELTPDGDEAFQRAEFLIASRSSCADPLQTVLELEITAHSRIGEGTDDVIDVEELVIEEIELRGQQPAAPDLHDIGLEFSSVANSIHGGISSGLLGFSYSGAPTRCAWSVSFTFTDFVSGDFTIPARQLIATGVEGLGGASVSSDQGVITIMIGERAEPRDADGSFQISLELDLGSWRAQGAYQTVATVYVAVMP
jgi:hypothetical protein